MSMPSASGRSRPQTYDFASNADPIGGREQSRLVKPGTVDVWRPSFKQGDTVIRILPCLNPDNPQEFAPYRKSAEPNHFGDWMRHYAVFRGGDPMTAFIIKHPESSADLSQCPAAVLRRAISGAIKSRQERPGWGALLQGGQGRSAQLPALTDSYLVTALIMEHGGQPQIPPKGFQAGSPLIMMDLPVSVGKVLLPLLNEIRPDYQGDPTDYNAMFTYGDPVSLEHGRFIRIFNAERPPGQTGTYNPQGGPASPFQAAQFTPQSRGDAPQGYGVLIQETWQNGSPCLAQYRNEIYSKCRWWDDILDFPSFDEQAELLSTRFPADAIMYGWADFPHWIPDFVRQKAVAAVSVPMPGGYPQPQPGYPQPMPGFPQQPSGPGFPQQPAGMQPPYQAPPVAPVVPMQQPGFPAPQGVPGAPAGFQGGMMPPPAQAPMQQPPMQQPPFGAPAGLPQPPYQAPPAPMQHTQQFPAPMQPQQPAGAFPAPMQQPQYQQPPMQQAPPQQYQQPPVQQTAYPVNVPPSPFAAPPGPAGPAVDSTLPQGGIPAQPAQQYQQPPQAPVQPQAAPGVFGAQPGNGAASQAAVDALARAQALANQNR